MNPLANGKTNAVSGEFKDYDCNSKLRVHVIVTINITINLRRYSRSS